MSTKEINFSYAAKYKGIFRLNMDFMCLCCICAEQLVWIQVTEAKKNGFINIVIIEILTNLKNKLNSHYTERATKK